MTDPNEKRHSGAGNEETKINFDDSTANAVHLDLDESKAHLINANGGAGKEHDDLKTAIIDPTSASSDGEISFTGLGKEEVMRYANDPFWVRLRWILFILFWLGWLAMLVTAIVIIVLAPRCPPRPDLKWYQTDTVYQVVPKSFKDSNNDGVGDFKGLKDKLTYITDLGIKAVWINSIFVSDKTSSLGVLDHKDIDESFGVSVEDFKVWLKKLRKEGLKIILDLIPNQTSKNHTWFQNSVKKDETYKDYYVWAEGNGNSPPNDWQTVDGKPAWTLDPTRNAWYFHQFSSSYPDLNLTNDKVKDEIKEIMKFWIDAGVSGFHIDGLEYLVENPDVTAKQDADLSQTRNYVGSLPFLAELRAVADEFSDKPGREKLLFGTVKDANKNQTQEYWGSSDKKRLHIVAPLLEKITAYCEADCLNLLLTERLNNNTDQWLGIQLGNEHTSRVTSRLTDNSDNTKLRLMIAHVVQLLFPGTPFNYYGDEFGQRNGDATVNPENAFRTPMQWNTEVNAGFTGVGVTPWLAVGSNYRQDNVQVNLAHFNDPTPYSNFKQLVKLRGRESFQWGKTEVCSPHTDILIFSRKATRFPYFLTVINTGASKVHISPQELRCVPTKSTGTIAFHSQGKEVNKALDFTDSGILLDKFDVVVIEFAADDE